ncbi:MAG: ribonuclease P protein component [Candidatus Pacebacteria bacterium]|nr:ribonuclease P protein component [Candidatus Paceibacterota bacterium]
MLPKRRRISRHEFETDHKKGSVFHAPHTTLRVNEAKTGTFRASVVVSKKIAKRSVDRHVFKRRVYDAIAQYEKKNPLPAYSYVVFAKRDVHTLSFATLRDEIVSLLTNACASIEKK